MEWIFMDVLWSVIVHNLSIFDSELIRTVFIQQPNSRAGEPPRLTLLYIYLCVCILFYLLIKKISCNALFYGFFLLFVYLLVFGRMVIRKQHGLFGVGPVTSILWFARLLKYDENLLTLPLFWSSIVKYREASIDRNLIVF